MSHKSVLEECPTRLSHESVLQECPTRLSHESVPQECPRRVSHKSVSHKSVPQECPIRVSYKSDPEECATRVPFRHMWLFERVCIRIRGLHLVAFLMSCWMVGCPWPLTVFLLCKPFRVPSIVTMYVELYKEGSKTHPPCYPVVRIKDTLKLCFPIP